MKTRRLIVIHRGGAVRDMDGGKDVDIGDAGEAEVGKEGP